MLPPFRFRGWTALTTSNNSCNQTTNSSIKNVIQLAKSR